VFLNEGGGVNRWAKEPELSEMIESRYWKEDLLDHARCLQPVKKVPRLSEKAQVNFEKEVIISFFKIRKLFESFKVSSVSKTYKATIFQFPRTCKKVTNLNFWDVSELYDLNNERKVKKSIAFICNQFIHGGATYAYRKKDRNWGGILVCSDYERNNFLYRVPLEEIISIFSTVGNDYPSQILYELCENKGDYVITTD
jgi:hypothetical protein